MGSYCDFRISGYSVISQKNRIDPELLSIFVEADKLHGVRAPDDQNGDTGEVEEDHDSFDGYCSTASAIAARLDLMGFTTAAARADFDLNRADELQQRQDTEAHWTSRDEISAFTDAKYEPFFDANFQAFIDAKYQKEIDLLTRLTFDLWLDGMRQVILNPAQYKNYDKQARKSVFSRSLDEIEAHILNESGDSEHPPLGFLCSDLRYLVRAFLLCTGPDAPVVLDCSDMVNAGYFEAGELIVEQARASAAAAARAVEKILVLTEGSSDTRILRETLNTLFPHLREFVSFLDYDQFAIAGGAGNLLNLLRGFAGAGVSNRVLALFDNDAAGTVQIRKARRVTLPSNFRVLQLPHLVRAESYPTLGPTGLVDADINGLACSIELYLGPAALTDCSGSLVPVQWTGYEKSLSRYQGELIDKKSVQDRYLELLRAGRADTSDIAAVFGYLFKAFHAS